MSDYSEDAKARIADLGSAVVLDSPSDTTNFKIGTPGYTAPEIIRGESYSFPVDVWSLGCILHVMLVAVPPFWEDDRKQREHKVCNADLNFNSNEYSSNLSDSCKDLLCQLLQKEPHQRPTIT